MRTAIFAITLWTPSFYDMMYIWSGRTDTYPNFTHLSFLVQCGGGCSCGCWCECGRGSDWILKLPSMVLKCLTVFFWCKLSDAVPQRWREFATFATNSHQLSAFLSAKIWVMQSGQSMTDTLWNQKWNRYETCIFLVSLSCFKRPKAQSIGCWRAYVFVNLSEWL